MRFAKFVKFFRREILLSVGGGGWVGVVLFGVWDLFRLGRGSTGSTQARAGQEAPGGGIKLRTGRCQPFNELRAGSD